MSATIVSLQEKDLRKFAAAIQGLAQGRSNAIGTVTLAPNVGTTTVSAPNCGAADIVNLTAQTANAAAALATTYVPAGNVTNGSFIITHANNAQSDRTFGFECRG
jgi:hypothetical protein